MLKFLQSNIEVEIVYNHIDIRVENVFLLRLTAAMPSIRIEEGNTCFIFDEIQDCPQARSSLNR